MSYFKRIYKTVIYWLIPFAFWCFVFFTFWTVKDFFYYLDYIMLLEPSLMSKALPCLFVGFLSIKYTFKFLNTIILSLKMKGHDNEVYSYGHSVGYDAEQDVGKTYTMTYDGMLLQGVRYNDLLYKYYVDCPIRDTLLEKAQKGNLFDWKLFTARKESVKYYQKNSDKIPCLYANNEVVCNGKTSYELEREHFTMDKRLPEHNIKLGDELANMLSNAMRTVKDSEKDEMQANKINEYASLDRQYTGGTLLSNDQRLGEIFIGIRTVMSPKRHLIEKQEVLKPKLFDFILSKLKTRVLKQGENCTLRLHKLCKFFERLVQKIGFLKIYYINEYAQEKLNLKNKEMQYFVLSQDVDFKYKHRGRLPEYSALDQSF